MSLAFVSYYYSRLWEKIGLQWKVESSFSVAPKGKKRGLNPFFLWGYSASALSLSLSGSVFVLLSKVVLSLVESIKVVVQDHWYGITAWMEGNNCHRTIVEKHQRRIFFFYCCTCSDIMNLLFIMASILNSNKIYKVHVVTWKSKQIRLLVTITTSAGAFTEMWWSVYF